MRCRALAAAVLAVAMAACGGVDPGELARACDPVQEFPEEGRAHVPSGQDVDYETNPPTSGDHDAIPAPTGAYTRPVPTKQQLVHNMEHGHIVIYVIPGRLPEATARGLVDVVNSDLKRILFVPHPLPFAPETVNVAFTAWRHSQKCDGTGPEIVEAARRFYKRFAGKGPEGDVPGSPARQVAP